MEIAPTVATEFGTKRASPLIVLMLAVAAALCAAVTLLPHDAYVRYQQLRDTIQFHAQWNYERRVNAYEGLAAAMRANPKLRLFWAAGYYDLTTPAYSGRYTLDQVGAPAGTVEHVNVGGDLFSGRGARRRRLDSSGGRRRGDLRHVAPVQQ